MRNLTLIESNKKRLGRGKYVGYFPCHKHIKDIEFWWRYLTEYCYLEEREGNWKIIRK
jgi:Zn-finger protein